MGNGELGGGAQGTLGLAQPRQPSPPPRHLTFLQHLRAPDDGRFRSSVRIKDLPEDMGKGYRVFSKVFREAVKDHENSVY